VPLEMSRKSALAAFFAGRAARIILAGSDPVDAPDNTAAQVSDIIVSNLVVREDASNGLVGYLYATGTTAAVTFSITSDPDGIFAIQNGNELHKVDAFGTGTDYAITIKATETVGGAEYSEAFTIDVIPTEDDEDDSGIGDGGGSGDVEIPDDEDPDADTDPYVEPPVEVVTEVAAKVSGKTGGTSVFLKDWGIPVAGRVYVMKYSADWTGMSAQGRYAAVGFGFKQGNSFHMVGLRGNGAVSTTMLGSRLYGDWRKSKQFTITNDGAATHGTKNGPNWLRLTVSGDASTYTLESSADGVTWASEIADVAAAPLASATSASQFGPAAYFYEEDKGPFVISISEFWQKPVNTVLPAITGTTVENETLTASTGTWTGAGVAYTYQWKRAGANIGGATASTYGLQAADVGSTITVAVTATNDGGATTATSAATAAIEADNSGSGATVLAGDETNVLALDFTDETFQPSTGRYGAAYILDVGTPANDLDSDPLSLLTLTEANLKILLRADGKYAYQNHNLALYSDDQTGAAWTASNLSSRTANTITDSSAVAYGSNTQTFTTTANVGYVLSFRIAKQVTATAQFGLGLSDGFLTDYVRIHPETGASAVGSGSFFVIESVADETTHWRANILFTATTTSLVLGFYPAGFTLAGSGNANQTGSVTIDQVALKRSSVLTETHLTTTSAAVVHLPIEFDLAGDPVGMLVEGARTNALQYSQTINQAYWTKNGVTVTANAVADPTGRSNAETLNEGTANGAHNFLEASVSITNGTTYTLSACLKAGTATIMQLGGRGGTFGANCWANFNLSTGAVGTTGASATARIVDLGGGWYRCIVTGTATGTSTGAIYIAFTNNNDALGAGPSYTGTSKTAHVWSVQVETGAFATSPVITYNGNARSRTADAYTLATTRYPHSATVNSAMVRYRPFNVASAMIALRWDDGTSNEVVSIGHSAAAALGLTVTDGGSGQTAPLNSGTATVNTWEKVAASWKANDFLFSDNGATAAADTGGTLPTVTSLDIGPSLFGHISHILVVPVEKSAAEVEAMAAA
jgi:hypothetical protein